MHFQQYEQQPSECFPVGICRQTNLNFKVPYWSLKARCLYFMGHYIVVVITFAIMMYDYSNDIKKISKRLNDQINALGYDPITDIRTTTNISICEGLLNTTTHYWQPAFQYQFPGFYNGCNCTNFTVTKKVTKTSKKKGTRVSYVKTRLPFYKRNCTIMELTKQNCTNYNIDQGPKMITEFGLNKQFCVQKLRDYNYSQFIKRGMVCRGFEKKCGNEFNYYCVPKNTLCPMIDVDLSQVNSTSSGIQRRLDEYNSNMTSYLADLTVMQGQYVCKSSRPYGYVKYSRYFKYHLLKGNYKSCYHLRDPLYRKIDYFKGITEQDLFTSQFPNISNKLPQKDVQAGIILGNSTYLRFNFFARNIQYFKQSSICGKTIIEITKLDYSRFQSSHSSIKIVCIFYYAFYYLFALFQLGCYGWFMRCEKICLIFWCSNKLFEKGWLDLTRQIYQTLFKSLIILYSVRCYRELYELSKPINRLFENGCLIDSYIAQNFVTKMTSFMFLFCSQVIIIGVSILVDVLVWRRFRSMPFIKQTRDDEFIELEQK